MISLKSKIKSNELTVGSWVTIANPAIVEIMATAGFEWLVIDMEHSSIDLYQAQILIAAIQANNMAALVRVSKNEEVIIKKVLDMGADGIIVPMVNNADEARRAVDYAYYPPLGKRGVGLSRAQQYGHGFDKYKSWLESELVIIAQIEHKDAIENIDEIVSTAGIDGIIIGPYDLSGSMGFPGEYQRIAVKESIQIALDSCSVRGKSSGFHVIETDPQILFEKVQMGCSFLAFSIDFLFLGDMARASMAQLNDLVNERE
jgi:2-dehydro-3-deoxyglucarate aldolase